MNQVYNISTMPLRRGHYKVLAVSMMEQIIGAALSTTAGIIIPMIVLIGHPHLSSLVQGLVGATGLVGIACGSAVIGRLSDREGYLGWFRVCPLLIVCGSAIVYFFPSLLGLVAGLFVVGIGVGGGYSLDSSYISEIMPDKWKLFMVGVAKGSCALGFLGAAVACLVILRLDPRPEIWHSLILIVGVLGLLTFLMRLSWRQSPHWLMMKGETAKAEEAVKFFLGSDVVINKPAPAESSQADVPATWGDMFNGDNLKKVILTGIPWACEGLGVYGFGVFLPVLIMALGLTPSHSSGGLPAIVHSIDMTAIVNFFILPGFVLGLIFVNKINHIKMLAGGFLACSLGLLLLLVAYVFKLPAAVSVAGFVIFEIFLNAGPHLVTFILPSQVYPVSDRGAGSGIAAMIGKIGAVVGVVLMPVLLDWGGMVLVLTVSLLVQLAGAVIAWIFGRKLLTLRS